MIIIQESGGVAYGPPDGPQIDIIPIPPRDYTPTLIVRSVEQIKSGMEWNDWRNVSKIMPAPTIVASLGNMYGVWGVGEDIMIRFLYPRDTSPLEAMYEIEQHEGEMPPAIVAAALTAARAKNLPTLAPSILARVSDMAPPDRYTRLNRRELEQLVDRYIDASLNNDPDIYIPPGSTDRCRFWLLAAACFWRSNIRREFAQRPSPRPEVGLIASSLAAAHLDLSDNPSVQVAGVNVRVSEKARPGAWPQVIEWDRGITSEALRYLTNGAMPEGKETVDQVILADAKPPTNEDADLCAGIASAMIREAEDNGVYVPNGGFTLALPPDFPLRKWGVGGLRVWADATEMWVSVIDDEGQVGASFLYRPGKPLSTWTVSAQAAPLLTVTLAALWRDLRVAGERATPERRKRRQSRRSTGRKRTRKRKSSKARTLPGGRWRIYLSGARQWGEDDEREAITRRAHGVRGHLRRLGDEQQASKEARETANDFGMVIPDGFTFVRPHVRGGEGEADVPGETVVRSRGLATVMSLLG
jgi:hypothetical protein